jgi:hypothetical protein
MTPDEGIPLTQVLDQAAFPVRFLRPGYDCREVDSLIDHLATLDDPDEADATLEGLRLPRTWWFPGYDRRSVDRFIARFATLASIGPGATSQPLTGLRPRRRRWFLTFLVVWGTLLLLVAAQAAAVWFSPTEPLIAFAPAVVGAYPYVLLVQWWHRRNRARHA